MCVCVCVCVVVVVFMFWTCETKYTILTSGVTCLGACACISCDILTSEDFETSCLLVYSIAEV